MVRTVALMVRSVARMAARPVVLTARSVVLTVRSVVLMAARGVVRRRDRVPPAVPPGCPRHRRSFPGGATARHRSFPAEVTTAPAPTAGTTRRRMPDPAPPADRAERLR
ncbi:hypothetical protein O7627_13610 [Solwaraspora sp. WMMD1047]|uniref:hypothetical protein n=1 Tax=Solwaraspora sp. WMMD1047 TaxID=3016102 RepID=UPI0024171E32|nr:hypothetical protein [Solwaraspora sp. WMMD1047]MDG4830336.1 hypothetical protein [Solwaraspora sp. WMMD1047]